MELEFINRIAAVFDEVIDKDTFLFLILNVLVGNRLVGRMRRFCRYKAMLAEEDFSFTIQFVNHIHQIPFVKKHLPIERVHVWCAFAIRRKVFVVDLEKINFPLIHQLINVVD